jgi:hypothetical protein
LICVLCVLIMSLCSICSSVKQLNIFGSGWDRVKIMSLKCVLRQSFLIVMSAVFIGLCGNIEMLVFNNTGNTYVRNLICLIISLVHYWSGRFHEAVKHKVPIWMPASLDLILLQMVAPNPMLTHGAVELP